MHTLNEFDIQSRGLKALLDEWETRHAEARRIWKIEDLISAVLSIMERASELNACFEKQGGLVPLSNGSVGDADDNYFADILRLLLDATYRLEDRASVHESVGYLVQGSDALRSGICELERILSAFEARRDAEEREWAELEKQALCADDFKRLAEHLMTTDKASA